MACATPNGVPMIGCCGATPPPVNSRTQIDGILVHTGWVGAGLTQTSSDDDRFRRFLTFTITREAAGLTCVVTRTANKWARQTPPGPSGYTEQSSGCGQAFEDAWNAEEGFVVQEVTTDPDIFTERIEGRDASGAIRTVTTFRVSNEYTFNALVADAIAAANQFDITALATGARYQLNHDINGIFTLQQGGGIGPGPFTRATLYYGGQNNGATIGLYIQKTIIRFAAPLREVCTYSKNADHRRGSDVANLGPILLAPTVDCVPFNGQGVSQVIVSPTAPINPFWSRINFLDAEAPGVTDFEPCCGQPTP
jgi:hypothetical protein